MCEIIRAPAIAKAVGCTRQQEYSALADACINSIGEQNR